MKRLITIAIDSGDFTCDMCDFLVGDTCRLYRNTAGQFPLVFGQRLNECIVAGNAASGDDYDQGWDDGYDEGYEDGKAEAEADAKVVDCDAYGKSEEDVA